MNHPAPINQNPLSCVNDIGQIKANGKQASFLKGSLRGFLSAMAWCRITQTDQTWGPIVIRVIRLGLIDLGEYMRRFSPDA